MESPPGLVTFVLSGGTYQWSLPEVKLGAPGAAPTIVGQTAPDPITGSTVFPLHKGNGAPFTDPSRTRLRYVQQSWSGHVLHDSWRDPGYAEAFPTGRLGDKILVAVLLAHRGDVLEIVIPSPTGFTPSSANGFTPSPATDKGESSVVVLSLDQV